MPFHTAICQFDVYSWVFKTDAKVFMQGNVLEGEK